MKFAIATDKNKIEVIKVTEKKLLVLTNITYGIDVVR